MKRGFKADAEKKANQIRQELGLSISEPLMGEKLASYFEVKIRTAARISFIPEEVKQQLWEVDSSSWSAFTITLSHKKLIFYNPTHSRGRHESNVMHEMSHLICGHEPSKFVSFEGYDFSLRTCRKEQEDEADWLCGCLKLPRNCLMWAIQQGMNTETIAAHFETNAKMVAYRRNVTGVDKQLRHRRAL